MTQTAPQTPVDQIVAAASRIVPQRRAPLVVAHDGASGAGKSTLARPLAERLNAAVVPLDDFFAAEIPNAQWDAWSPSERRAHVNDWQRLRIDVLTPLMAEKNSANHH